jgi:adenosylmethionine---8-amino-7-oxononanoate aminotransferase
MSWTEDDEQFVWHPFTQVEIDPKPISVIRAQGATFFTDEGKSYLDCNSSWWVNLHGHGHPEIQAAIQEQFSKIDHIIFAGATHEPAVQLSKKIIKLTQQQLQKVFFSDNGSTAVEVALKMSIQYFHNKNENRRKILALQGAYHGDTFGAMSVGERDVFNRPFEAHFFQVDFLDFPTPNKELDILQKAKEFLSKNEHCALIVEPLIQGSAGMRIYSVDFLEKLVSLAQQFGTLVIFDEVMTAWGRTGKTFAFQHTQVVPDLLCLSKGLTGGVLPMGLTVSSQKIFDAFKDKTRVKAFLHGHSFTANPLACAAANKSIEILERKETQKNIQFLHKQHIAFRKKVSHLSKVKEVRILGTILAIELKTETSGYFSEERESAYRFFMSRGILLRPLGNVLYVNPPYCITVDELSVIYESILAFLDSANTK